MPITREQFEKGLDETRYKILKFLTGHPDKAYDVDEVGRKYIALNPPHTGQRQYVKQLR